MKVLVVYNKYSGKKKNLKWLNYICEKLKTRYEIVELFFSDKPKSITEYIISHDMEYELIAVAGGDGTINEVINAVMKLKRRPTLAYIPMGTCNDASKSLGLSRNIKKTMKIILKDNKTYLDVFKINDSFFGYGMAMGNLVDISYNASPKLKKKFGRFAYYIEVLHGVFKDKSINLDIVADKKSYNGLYFLFLATNSRYLASFKLRKKERIFLDDSKLSVVLIKKKNRLINLIDLGLYLLLGDRYKHNIISFEASQISIKVDKVINYNTDGEKSVGDCKIDIEVIPEQVEVIVSKKVLRKHFNKYSSY